MKPQLLIVRHVSILGLLLVSSQLTAGSADMYPGHVLSARFEGHYPCSPPDGPKCDRLKVWLFLFHDEQSEAPSLYHFGYIPVGVDNERHSFEGRWQLESRGSSAHPGVPIIELDAETPVEFRRHWKVEPHLLLLLNEAGEVRPGHPDGGYTLYDYSLRLIRPAHWPS